MSEVILESKPQILLPVRKFAALEKFTMQVLREKARRVHEAENTHRFAFYDSIAADTEVQPGDKERLLAVKLGRRGYAHWGMRFLISSYSLDTPAQEPAVKELFKLDRTRSGDCWGSHTKIEIISSELVAAEQQDVFEKIEGFQMKSDRQLESSELDVLQGRLEAMSCSLPERLVA